MKDQAERRAGIGPAHRGAGWLLVIGLLGALPAAAQTLQEIYALARQNDPKFRAATLDFEASGQTLEQARAAYRPAIKLELDQTKSHQRIITSENPIFAPGDTDYPTKTNTLSLNQPVYRKDLLERLDQSRALLRQAEFTLRAAEQDLQLRSTAAYLLLLAARDSLALASAEREALGKTLDLAREKQQSGLGNIIVLHDATARYAVAQAREIEARNKLADARQALREITGALVEQTQSLRADFPLTLPEPPLVEAWLETAGQNNLTLQARQEAVEVARLEYERQRAGHFPSVDLLANYNRRDSGSTLFGGGSDVETTDLTLRLSVPIYQGGMVDSMVREATLRQQKAQEDLEQERRAVERSTRAFFDGVRSGAGLVQALGQSVLAQESALAAKQEGFKSGLYTLLPVLDAQRDLYLARRDYAQARYDYLLYRLRLRQVSGSLSEADFKDLYAALE